MTAGLRARMAQTAVAPLTDPLGTIPWVKAAWADDPLWVNPGNGAAVTSWRNAGSIAGDFGSVAGSPTFVSSATLLNNRAAVTFTITDGLKTATFTPVAQPFTFVWIGRRTGPGVGGNDRLVSSSDGGSQRVLLFMNTSTGKWSTYAGSAIGDSTVSGDTTKHALRALYAGASSRIVADVVSTNISPGVNIAINVWLNQEVAAGSFFGAQQMAFVGLYPGNITADANWPAFQAWVLSYYGITLV